MVKMVDSRSEAVKLETEVKEEINPSETVPLVRQSSIFSLTLEELQNIHYWNERNLGSMNMDELLNNLRTTPGATDSDESNGDDDGDSSPYVQHQPQQVPLSVPSPFIGKTGQEIWEEIQREYHEEDDEEDSNGGGESHAPPAMTLEDFLMRTRVPSGTYIPPSAPVLSVTVAPPVAALPRVAPATEGQQFGLFMNNNNTTAAAAALGPTGFGITPTLRGMGIAMGGINIQPFPFAGVTGERSNYAGIGVGNGGGAIGVTISPASPLSSDGLHRENSERIGIGGGGAEMRGGFGRRKRGIEDGSAADVVGERKQKRMIKNRESAARSRARKQAYTVEIETELKKLSEENAQLKQNLLEIEKKLKWLERQKELTKTKAQKKQEKLRRLRRCSSAP